MGFIKSRCKFVTRLNFCQTPLVESVDVIKNFEAAAYFRIYEQNNKWKIGWEILKEWLAQYQFEN